MFANSVYLLHKIFVKVQVEVGDGIHTGKCKSESQLIEFRYALYHKKISSLHQSTEASSSKLAQLKHRLTKTPVLLMSSIEISDFGPRVW